MKIYKISKLITIYRGEHSGNKNGYYYSIDKEFARQFTQSGLDKEILVRKIDTNSIYDSRTENKPLPSANNEKEFDEAIEILQMLLETSSYELGGKISNDDFTFRKIETPLN